jgi:hypothetical protein
MGPQANYQFTYYVAEVANTFSNLVTISIALTAAYLTRREGLPLRHFFSYLVCVITYDLDERSQQVFTRYLH